MSRIDYTAMGRNLEKLDPVLMSYIGYLHWVSHHTNPIVMSFCEIFIINSIYSVNCNKKKKIS